VAPIFAVLGTDTGVGKTRIACLLARGLRAAGARVFCHKPVASGGDEDAAALRAFADPDQDPATVCPLVFPEAAAPSRCARAHGVALTRELMAERIAALQAPDRVLIVEGAGGVLAPLGSDDATILDVLAGLAVAPILVARPHLGTINHTRLSVDRLRAGGMEPSGLVVNHHQEVVRDLATTGIAAELAALCACPLLAETPFGAAEEEWSARLAEALAPLAEARR